MELNFRCKLDLVAVDGFQPFEISNCLQLKYYFHKSEDMINEVLTSSLAFDNSLQKFQRNLKPLTLLKTTLYNLYNLYIL